MASDGTGIGPEGPKKAKLNNTTYCCVPQCNVYSGEGVRFHHFPKDLKLRLQWQNVLRMGKKITDYDRVCNAHFLPTDYIPQAKPSAVRRLKKIAVPSQNLPIRLHDVVESSPQKKQKQARKRRAENREARLSAENDRSMHEDANLSNEIYENNNSHEEVDNTTAAGPPETEGETPPAAPALKEKSTQTEQFSLLTLLPEGSKLCTFTGLTSYKLLDKIVLCVTQIKPESLKMNLTNTERVLLCLTKLRLNMSYASLSVFFGISDETCSKYFRYTVQVLAEVLKGLVKLPSVEETRKNIPKCFRRYSYTRIVLDCMEIPVEKPRCLKERIMTYSQYKGRHTLKTCVGVSPSGMIIFMSKFYGGRASDKKIVVDSEILNCLEFRDGVMVDKGFMIEKECIERNLRMIRPPFLSKKKALSKAEAIRTAEIARARVHVERSIKQIRDYAIMTDQISSYLVPYMNDIALVCVAMVNLSSPILAMDKF
ncbi:THAP domain-containing protein 11 [Frankliniella fusca]|uniref:THAP domain-containing protein 11 n=1 Tax=Frankliniella fusca TaxID=407009 RepID=A0AAE1HRC0_9NEOP|nr:THAP domain-containing protein 11 [Frankliniella fusca]